MLLSFKIVLVIDYSPPRPLLQILRSLEDIDSLRIPYDITLYVFICRPADSKVLLVFVFATPSIPGTLSSSADTWNPNYNVYIIT